VAPGAWQWAWTLGIAASFLAYVLVVWSIRRRAGSCLPILVAAVAMQLAPLTGPLLLSSDVYSYWTYGRLAAIHDGNPYADLPADHPGDPAFRIVGEGIAGQTTIYGPGFTAVSELHARVAGPSPRAAQYLYRLGAAAGALVLLAIVAVGATRPAFSVAFIGLNPLIALHAAGGGHNDIWMVALAVGGVLLGRHRRPALAGASWAASASVKAATLLIFPLEALAAVRRDPRLGARLVASAIAGGAALAGLASLRYGTEWTSFYDRASSQIDETSSISSVFQLQQLGLSSDTSKTLLQIALVAGSLRLLVDAWNGRARLGLASALLILTPAWLVAWYGTWTVGLSAVDDDPAAELVALATTAYLLSGAIPLTLAL